jgi:hypothetical protein
MQQLLNDVMFEGKPDIERRPEYWRPYADKKQHVIERLKPLHDLVEARPASRDRIVRVAQNRDRSLHRLGYVPLIGQDRDFAFVVDSETGALLDLIDVDPWIE